MDKEFLLTAIKKNKKYRAISSDLINQEIKKYFQVNPKSVKFLAREKSNGYWLITLGAQPQGQDENLEIIGPKKEYKIFKIDSETGEVVSMKIRKVE